MDNYFYSYREMISLRGLTDHTMKSYCTYIRAYLGYLSDVLHKDPVDVTRQELRDYIKWLQKTRQLNDRTINTAISQLRFFTIYVLHKPWDSTQLPLRKFDTYIPFVPSKEEVWQFISTMPDLKQKRWSLSCISPVCVSGRYVTSAMSISNENRCVFTSLAQRTVLTDMPFFLKMRFKC